MNSLGLLSFALLFLFFSSLLARPSFETFLDLPELLPERLPFVFFTEAELRRVRSSNGQVMDPRLVQNKDLSHLSPDGAVFKYHHHLRIQPNVLSLDLEPSVLSLTCTPDDVIITVNDLKPINQWQPGTKFIFSQDWGCEPDRTDSPSLLRAVLAVFGLKRVLFEGKEAWQATFVTDIIAFSDVFQEVTLSFHYIPALQETFSDLSSNSSSLREKRGDGIRSNLPFDVNYNPTTGRALSSFALLSSGSSSLVCSSCYLRLQAEIVYNLVISAGTVQSFLVKVGGRITFALRADLNLRLGTFSKEDILFKARVIKIPFTLYSIPLTCNLHAGLFSQASLSIASQGTVSVQANTETTIYVGAQYTKQQGFSLIREGPSLASSLSRTFAPSFAAVGQVSFGIGPYLSVELNLGPFSIPATFKLLPYLQFDFKRAGSCALGYTTSKGLDFSATMEPLSLLGYEFNFGGILPFSKAFHPYLPAEMTCTLCKGCFTSFSNREIGSLPQTDPFIPSAIPSSPLRVVPDLFLKGTTIFAGETHFYTLRPADADGRFWLNFTLEILSGDADLTVSIGDQTAVSDAIGDDWVLFPQEVYAQFREDGAAFFIMVSGYANSSTYRLAIPGSPLVFGYWFLTASSPLGEVIIPFMGFEDSLEYLFTFENYEGGHTVLASVGEGDLPSANLGSKEDITFIMTPSLYCETPEGCVVTVTIPQTNNTLTSNASVWIMGAPLTTVMRGSSTPSSLHLQQQVHYFWLGFSSLSELQFLAILIQAEDPEMDIDAFVSTRLYAANSEFNDFAAQDYGDELMIIPAKSSGFVIGTFLYNAVPGNFSLGVFTIDIAPYGTGYLSFSLAGEESSEIMLLPSPSADTIILELYSPNSINLLLPAVPVSMEGGVLLGSEGKELHLHNQTVLLTFNGSQSELFQFLHYWRDPSFDCGLCLLSVTKLVSLQYITPNSHGYNQSVHSNELLHYVVENSGWKQFNISVEMLAGDADVYVSFGEELPTLYSASVWGENINLASEFLTVNTDLNCNIGVFGFFGSNFILRVTSVEIQVPPQPPSAPPLIPSPTPTPEDHGESSITSPFSGGWALPVLLTTFFLTLWN